MSSLYKLFKAFTANTQTHFPKINKYIHISRRYSSSRAHVGNRRVKLAHKLLLPRKKKGGT